MLDLSNPSSILQEIEADERIRDAHLRYVPDLVRMYTGPKYNADLIDDADPAPENHPFEWLSWITPKIIDDNPRVSVNARGSGVARDVPVRLEHGINQWASATVLWRQLQQVFVDMSFAFGVMRVGVGPIPGHRGVEKRHWAAAKRVDPKRFVIDTRGVSAQHEARYMAHLWRRDKDDLLSSHKPGLNKKVIAAMAVDKDMNKVERQQSAAGRPDRKEILGWEVWVPEFELPRARVDAYRKRQMEMNGGELPEAMLDDDQLNGTILTLGLAVQGDARGKPQWIREPRPFWGPACGPYELYGVYIVPGQIYPLSPLLASYEELVEVNAHATAMSVGAANWRRFIAVDASNPRAFEQAQNAKHGSVVAIEGADKAIKSVETGGVAGEQYTYFEFLRQRLARRTGQNEGARGDVSGDATATEYADVASQRESRVGMIRRLFNEHTRAVLYRAGWNLYHNEFARFDLPSAAVADLMPRPQFLPPETQAESIAMDMAQGKRPTPPGWEDLTILQLIEQVRKSLAWAPRLQFPFEDAQDDVSMADVVGIPYDQLELSIDPMSMGRVDQAMQMRLAQDQVSMVSETCALMPANPHIKWDKLYDTYGDAHNVRRFSDIIDMDALRQLWQAQAMAAQAAAMPQDGMGGMGGAPPVDEELDPLAMGIEQDPELMAMQAGGSQGLPGNFSGAGLAALAR